MTGRRELNRIATRGRVLDAAKELFAERGVAGTTASDLASAARISRATFFNHFGSKEELLLALWEDQVGTLGDQISAHLGEALTTGQRIRLLFSDLATALRERPGYLQVVAVELERTSTDVSAATRLTYFHHQVRRIVDAGLDRGDVRTDHEPALLAEMIAAVYLGVLRNLRVDGAADPSRRITASADFIADAVCSCPPPTPPEDGAGVT